MAEIDLNELRRTVTENREREQERPPDRTRKVLVSPDGQIVLGRSLDDVEGTDLSEIPQGTFATEVLE